MNGKQKKREMFFPPLWHEGKKREERVGDTEDGSVWALAAMALEWGVVATSGY